MNTIKLFGLALSTAFVLTSCSDDNGTNSGGPIPDVKVLFTSNLQNGKITYYDLTNRKNIVTTTLATPSTAADGVYYDKATDVAVQASRSANALEGYLNISLQPNNTQMETAIFGSSDMQSPRKMVVKDNFYVVADNANANGRFFIYQRAGNKFTLRNIITTDFKVWGITFDKNRLYAVVDGTNELAVFEDFLSTTTTSDLSAQKRIKIEGIVRTHGVVYDEASDTMILTDIGDAANAENDGAFHLINDFTTKLNPLADGETLAMAGQIRVSGTKTFLGNPVDVAYDRELGTVFIAEAGNAGGRILAFENFGNGGDIPPFISNSLAGASSVYFHKE